MRIYQCSPALCNPAQRGPSESESCVTDNEFTKMIKARQRVIASQQQAKLSIDPNLYANRGGGRKSTQWAPGQLFNDLIALGAARHEGRSLIIDCLCTCGIRCQYRLQDLVSGRMKSCGCQQYGNLTSAKKQIRNFMASVIPTNKKRPLNQTDLLNPVLQWMARHPDISPTHKLVHEFFMAALQKPPI